MKTAAEFVVTGSTNTAFPSSYDSTKINLGPIMRQNTGALPTDKFLSTQTVSFSRPAELVSGSFCALVHVLTWSSTIDWVFLGDNSTAAATRRVLMYTFNKSTGVYTSMGGITLTYPTATSHTMRGLMATRDTYSTGTVAVTGTAVTGTSTLWTTNNIAAGARIGFGTTDPTLVTTWYEISAVGSNTGITLTTTIASTLGAGTAYVIEEIRVVTTTTNATTTNGGLFVAKGLNPNTFQNTPTVIAAATTIDNIRAVYWLADAATVTNITAGGIGYESKVDNSNHFVYVTDGAATTLKIFKYNIRATLASLAAGKSVSAFVFATGNQTVTGNIAQNNNGRVATLSHGSGSGVACMYIVTTTRVIRVPLVNIVSGSTAYIGDVMLEIPPGGTNTHIALGAMATVNYLPTIDRLVITNTGASGGRGYCTRYYNTGTAFDHFFLVDTKQNDNSSADSTSIPMPSISTSICSVWEENGFAHVIRHATTSNPNQLYAVPVSGHWAFASGNNNRVITYSISTPNATKFYTVYVNYARLLGASEFGVVPEPFRLYVRTSGITDNTGTWQLVSDTGDLAFLAASNTIQFMFEFRVMGMTSIPARIYGLTVLYESTDAIPSQYQWNLSDSNLSDGTMGFVQISSYGSVPGFQIDYYRSDTNANIFTQLSSSTANGTFQYWNGSAWIAGTGTDTVGLRRRFVPTAGLPSGVDIYAKISTF